MNKRKVNLILGIGFYILSFVLIFYYLFLEFSIYELSSPLKRLMIVFIIVLFTYLGCFLLRKDEYKGFQKLPKFNLLLWFTLYIVMILNLTLFDSYFGRSGGVLYSYNPVSIKNYFTYNFNMIPFKTINNYFLAYRNHNIAFINLFYNILGNVIAFMPLAFFLPRLFKEEKWYTYFSFTTCCILFIEIMQLVTNSGSFDIDDYILNMLGFIFLYILINNRFIKDRLDKVLMI